MTSKLLWRHAICMKRCVNTSAVRSLTVTTSKKSKQDTDSFNKRPTHKAVGTFGSLTVVNKEDKAFKIEETLCKDLHSSSESEPLVIILGWAGATHKVTLIHNFLICDL